MGAPFFNVKATKQRPAKKEKKPKKERSYQKNRIRIVIWAFLILFVLASLQSILVSRNALSQLRSTQSKVTVLEKELKKISNDQALDVPPTNAFLTDFFKTYYSVSKERDQEIKRREKLANYYAPLGNQTSSTPQTDLKVNTIMNYGYRQKGNSYVGTFFVETKTTQEQEKTFQSVVSVDFKITKKGYQICSMPYQQSDTRNDFVTKNNQRRQEKRSDTLQDLRAKEKIQEFVKQFLKEYEQNNGDNLRYLMREVEGLPANVKVETKDFSVFNTAEKPIVDLTLMLTYKDTGITFQEGLELHLIKNEDGKYFIETIDHY